MSATSSSEQSKRLDYRIPIMFWSIIISLVVLYQHDRTRTDLKAEIKRLEEKIDILVSTDQQQKANHLRGVEKTPE